MNDLSQTKQLNDEAALKELLRLQERVFRLEATLNIPHSPANDDYAWLLSRYESLKAVAGARIDPSDDGWVQSTPINYGKYLEQERQTKLFGG